MIVGHKEKESHRPIRFPTEVASDPGLEPGALRLGGARSYPTELIRHLFYFTQIDWKINALKLLKQKKFNDIKDSQSIENYAKTMPKRYPTQYIDLKLPPKHNMLCFLPS